MVLDHLTVQEEYIHVCMKRGGRATTSLIGKIGLAQAQSQYSNNCTAGGTCTSTLFTK